MSFVIVHCIVSICCSIQSAAIEHLGPICKQHGIELSMGQMISKGIFDIVTLSTIVHKIDPDFTSGSILPTFLSSFSIEAVSRKILFEKFWPLRSTLKVSYPVVYKTDLWKDTKNKMFEYSDPRLKTFTALVLTLLLFLIIVSIRNCNKKWPSISVLIGNWFIT